MCQLIVLTFITSKKGDVILCVCVEITKDFDPTRVVYLNDSLVRMQTIKAFNLFSSVSNDNSELLDT